jgi:hypothetical protein
MVEVLVLPCLLRMCRVLMTVPTIDCILVVVEVSANDPFGESS